MAPCIQNDKIEKRQELVAPSQSDFAAIGLWEMGPGQCPICTPTKFNCCETSLENL
jgi:hypothetical protein